VRKDRFGNLIEPGAKSHKISFRDKIGKGKLKDIYLVESYKKYNGMDDLQEETNVTCKCSIF
jgi:hypothetical protein